MNDQQAERVGQWLRQARESRRWTQDDLAREADVSIETVRKIETGRLGKRGPSMKTRSHLEAALGVAPHSLDRVADGQAVSFAPVDSPDAGDVLTLIEQMRDQLQRMDRRLERLERDRHPQDG